MALSPDIVETSHSKLSEALLEIVKKHSDDPEIPEQSQKTLLGLLSFTRGLPDHETKGTGCMEIAISKFMAREQQYLYHLPLKRLEELLAILKERPYSGNSSFWDLAGHLRGRIDMAHEIEEATHATHEETLGIAN